MRLTILWMIHVKSLALHQLAASPPSYKVVDDKEDHENEEDHVAHPAAVSRLGHPLHPLHGAG